MPIALSHVSRVRHASCHGLKFNRIKHVTRVTRLLQTKTPPLEKRVFTGERGGGVYRKTRVTTRDA